MNNELLQGMTLETLIDLLAKNTTDLLKAIEKKDRPVIVELTGKVELIQELITQKKTQPGSLE